MRFLWLFIIIGALFFSCKKNTIAAPEDMPPLGSGNTSSLSIQIDHVVNGSTLALGTQTYAASNNQVFSVTSFKYYFTNISLTNHHGDVVIVPGSYYLIDEANPLSRVINLSNIPPDDYTTLSFMIGVDSHQNTSGAQAGALDPLNGMFWDWNSGYIMAKMEGASPQSGSSIKDLSFHIGGFNGANSGVRTVTLSLPVNAQVQTGHQPKITLSADLAKWFTSVNTISFATVYSITSVNAVSKSIADNYATMFTVTSVTN